jgi:hypothetical protein
MNSSLSQHTPTAEEYLLRQTVKRLLLGNAVFKIFQPKQAVRV